ncbi:MarR family winged helix-turn-helix transcriptional regulator [Homoserinibacter sp. GY 40078]|uniref:MarR family winged helix-turn-helix transcriptional regulator n=1 Tax=Homoserinibacter sp. GY 40078 TaxID=2603275 RepID=UPI0011C9AD4C|nr:MarR family winged helix-turn-helix transcriptional regulator [Homoserinibacter sp. GY 40078]TXK17192.1 winged helix-turn-helix transcriptional regulator [Homoserinibacter sp. GY 40078]
MTARLVPRLDAEESAAWLSLITLLELLPSALDSQLQRDSDMTHFEFGVLSFLRFSPDQTVRMTELAAGVAATLPRLSHVITRLERRGIVERLPCMEDRRATNVRLTTIGRRELVRAIPGHIALVRRVVIDSLSREQLDQLATIASSINRALDPDERYASMFTEQSTD